MNIKDWNYLSIDDCADVIGGGTPSTKNPDYWNEYSLDSTKRPFE